MNLRKLILLLSILTQGCATLLVKEQMRTEKFHAPKGIERVEHGSIAGSPVIRVVFHHIKQTDGLKNCVSTSDFAKWMPCAGFQPDKELSLVDTSSEGMIVTNRDGIVFVGAPFEGLVRLTLAPQTGPPAKAFTDPNGFFVVIVANDCTVYMLNTGAFGPNQHNYQGECTAWDQRTATVPLQKVESAIGLIIAYTATSSGTNEHIAFRLYSNLPADVRENKNGTVPIVFVRSVGESINRPALVLLYPVAFAIDIITAPIQLPVFALFYYAARANRR